MGNKQRTNRGGQDMNQPKIRMKGFDGEWENTTFRCHLIAVQTGTNLLGSVDNKGIPLIKMGNIQRGYFIHDKLEYLEESIPIDDNYIVKYGDFFFNTRNTMELVGKGATWMQKNGLYAYNSNIARCELNGIDTFFFNYLYNTAAIIKQVQARAKGTTSVAAVYLRDLNSIKLFLPPLPEQKAIAEYFVELDRLIGATGKELEKLRTVKAASLQSLFPQEGETVPKIRFKGFEGEWKRVKLGDLFSERIESNIYGEMLSVTMNNGIIKASENGRHDNSNRDKSHYKVVKVGDIAYNSMRMWQGASGRSDYEGIVSPAYTVLFACDGVDSLFFSYLFKTNNALKLFTLYSQGLTSDTWNLKYPAFSKISVLYPLEIAEQQKIASFLQSLDNQIELQSKRLEKLRNIKAACLDNMFV